MNRILGCLLFVLLLLGPPSLTYGQVGTEGSMFGTVQDSSGAVIPGAKVTVENLNTGLSRSATTDNAGNFEVLALPVGPYSISVTSPGFKTWRVSRTEIMVGSRARVSPTLEVGDVSEQIQVEATEALLQTERSSVGTVVQMNQIRELPLSLRNPLVLVNMVPGMRYLGTGGPERGTTVQGFGTRDNQTQFQLDGVNSNAAMDEGGMAIPNVDTVAEFNVLTNSFSAEFGRNPLQVQVVTKSGTNEFHGALWEFLQNDKVNARNTFATTIPKLRRNQFGVAVGGPVIRNKTFFFGSMEGTLIRNDSIYNSVVPSAAMVQGDFSATGRTIRDPQTGQPFAGGVIPQSRFSSASQFFFPYLVSPNSPDGRFREIAPNKNNTYEYTGRVDHQLTDAQRIYGRAVVVDNKVNSPGYRPDVRGDNNTRQYNIAGNYTNTLTPSMLLTVSAGYVKSDNTFTSPVAGIENLTQKAGIQGFPTEGREDFVGMPNVSFAGYTGFNAPWGVPGRLWSDAINIKAGLNMVRGGHTINFGYEFDDRSVYGRHGSHSPRGGFTFNSQYTGDGFADYLLGMVSSTLRNFPLESFGLQNAPYSGLYVQDAWRVKPNLTLNLGLRYERWHERQLVAGNGATFDPRLGKVIAGVDTDGNMNLDQQPVSKFLAAATQGLWITAKEAGVPYSLGIGNGNWAPRLGLTWRPFSKRQFVVRGGYGTFYNSFTGNRAASSIVGPPYWAWEANTFSALTLQRWETAWPADPRTFIQPSIGEAPAWDLRQARTHQFNVSLQTALPWKSALTISYVGTRLDKQVSMRAYNEVAPGSYANLQAAKPYPAFGSLNVLENFGESWYNGLQLKAERRFVDGLSFMLSYSFAKDISENTPSNEYDAFVPFAPQGYLRGRSGWDRTHILFFNTVWEIPVGHGHKWGASMHKAADLLIGGWQLSGINSFTSGSPLSVIVPGATLGNGWNTRANLVGDLKESNPTRDRWFNTAAFSAPAAFQWGTSGQNIFDGPGRHVLDLGIMKNFRITESKYFQFRTEMFNALNHVNLNNPGTTLNTPAFGRILSAGAARTIQFGLKFLF